MSAFYFEICGKFSCKCLLNVYWLCQGLGHTTRQEVTLPLRSRGNSSGRQGARRGRSGSWHLPSAEPELMGAPFSWGCFPPMSPIPGRPGMFQHPSSRKPTSPAPGPLRRGPAPGPADPPGTPQGHPLCRCHRLACSSRLASVASGPPTPGLPFFHHLGHFIPWSKSSP